MFWSLITVLVFVPGSDVRNIRLSYPVGSKQCMEKCQRFGDCKQVYYNINLLRCVVLLGSRAQGSKNPFDLLINVSTTSKAGLCSHLNCTKYSKCITTRQQQTICVKTGRFRITRTVYSSRRRTSAQARQQSTRAVSNASTGVQRRQWTLATTTKLGSVGDVSSVVKVDFTTYKSSKKLTVRGRIVGLEIYGDHVYWCLRGPDGLFRSRMGEGEMWNNSQTQLTNVRCSNLAGSYEEQVLFFTLGNRVWRELPKRIQITEDDLINSDVYDLLLTLDRKYKMMYVCEPGSKKVAILDYTGDEKGVVFTSRPLARIHVWGRNIYYAQTTRYDLLVEGIILPKGLKFRYAHIKTHVVDNNRKFGVAPFGVMTVSRRSVLLLDRHTFGINSSVTFNDSENITGFYSRYDTLTEIFS